MSRRRARRLLLPLAACALASGAVAATAATPADPAPLLLRLPDLGPGYVLARADRACVVLRASLPRLRSALGPEPFRGCLLSFNQVWTPPGASPGPGGVQSFAFAFGSPTGPTTALSRPRRLAATFLGSDRGLRVVEPAPPIGDQAALVRMDRTLLGISFSAGLAAWRSRSVLGIVVAGSLGKGDANVPAAVRLATAQQARIANPTPLRPPVNDDRFVPLDDPTLGAPVLWLGERLPAHGRRPALELWATGAPFDFREHPLVQMVYRTPRSPQNARIDLWRPRGLRRHLHRPLRPLQCRRRVELDVPGARAWVDAVSVREPRRPSGRCPHRGASLPAGASLTAGAFFDDGVGVTIDARGAYDSPTGLRTLLRALHPRPLPAP